MAARHQSWRALRGVGLAGLIGLVGCGKSGDSSEAPSPPSPPAAIPGPVADAPIPVPPPATPPVNLSPVPIAEPVRYDTPFAEAVTTQLYSGATLPPTTTTNGHPVPKLQAGVRDLWPSVAVLDAAGKPAPIIVAIDTDAGPVEITLFPDIAPNHVRNFLALAQLGYYNGLGFERVIRFEFEGDDKMKRKLELVTAGCPVGDGEAGHGHLGYFLKPERQSLQHEEGVIGFVREEDPASASCRLYLCVTPAPMMDGHYTGFGKVTAGLDLLKGIAARPVKDAAKYPENEQFKDPVKIKTVTRK